MNSGGCSVFPLDVLEEQLNLDLKEGFTGFTALMLAAGSGFEKVVEVLLQHRADVDKEMDDGKTALMFAAKEGNEKVVEMLLQYGADVDKQDSKGWTALMYASNCPQFSHWRPEGATAKIVEMLRAAGSKG